MASVLHLTRDFPPHSNGGLSTAVGGLVAASTAYGCRNTVLSYDAWRPLATKSNPVLKRPPKTQPSADCQLCLRLNSGHNWQDALAQLASFHFDCVVVHHEMLWHEALELALRYDCPITYYVHSYQIQQQRIRKAQRRTLSLDCQEQALREVSRIVVPSQSLRDLLLHDYPHAATTCRVIGLGHQPPTNDCAPLRESHHHGPPHLLWVGRFSDIKGIDLLCDFVATAAVELPEAHTHVLGGLPENPRAQRRWMRRLRQAQPNERLLQLHGWRNAEEIFRHMRRCNLLLHTSRYETFGQVILEAMAAELPICAFKVGAIPELLRHEMEGLLAKPFDIHELVSLCRHTLLQPIQTHTRTKAAKQRYLADFRWEVLAPQHIDAWMHDQ